MAKLLTQNTSGIKEQLPKTTMQSLSVPNLSGIQPSNTVQELSVLFADIKNFTQTFEYDSPSDVEDQLNTYFSSMATCIAEFNGQLETCTGDGLMAIFGLTEGRQALAALDASRCALAMQAELDKLNDYWLTQERKRLQQGIGISSGPMLRARQSVNKGKGTVLGNPVTLGARLEQYTRVVNAHIVICEETCARLQLFIAPVTQDLGLIKLKGFSAKQHAYALECL